MEALEPQQDEEAGSLARLITSLDKIFKGRSEELAGTLEGSATVLENLADSNADITGLITEPGPALRRLATPGQSDRHR